MKQAQDQRKSFTNQNGCDLELEVDDHVFVKIGLC